MRIDDFVDMFLQFEYENNMFDKKVEDIYYWKYIRYQIEVNLCNYFNLYSKGLNSKNKLKEHKYSTLEKIKIDILKNPKLWKKRDVLIIPHTRKYELEDGSVGCIYTNELNKNLKRSHYIFDRENTEGFYNIQKGKNIIYSDINTQFNIQRGKNILYSKEMFETDILRVIEQWFGIEVSVQDKNTWFHNIKLFLNCRFMFQTYYEHVLDIISPKIVIMVVGYDYGQMILCEVAQKRKIPVVELQHGEVNRNHAAYNYLYSYDNLAFPDYFFCYGERERENVRFPITKERVIPVGFPELERASLLKSIKGEKKRIMFVSQLNPAIAEYAYALDKMLPSEKYEIIFKLHPKEYDDWKQRYGELLLNSNIQIVGDYKGTIHQYLKTMDWVIGVSSTVLIEATMYDVNIIILKQGLYENLKELYENEYAVLVDSIEELVLIIKDNLFKSKKETDKFFVKNGIENMLSAIENIIKNNECV